MALFQKSVLKKHLQGLDSVKLESAYQTYIAHFHNPAIQDNIRNAKEEQYQEGFLRELFVKILGYTLNPQPDYNLTTEFKNIKGSKKADGAILQAGKAIAVIELKGTNTTDLDKIEAQAFGYKNNQPDAVYVITSNFEKLRFYIDNAVEHEEFNLFSLSLERFKLLWLCLAQESVFKGLPKRIKESSIQEEENVTKKLYKDYSAFKKDIFQSMVKLNPEQDKLSLFKKTQKLLDRFLFIFFAEDRLLLPPNSIRSIIDQWTDLRDKYDTYFPLYDRFKKYFEYMNTGYKGKQYEIFAYNGGLFEPDPILDNLKIDDLLLYTHTQNLSHYDFESEVDVNILGHIFEHSLTEIEEITAQLEGQSLDAKTSKRKKDGVFYTPKYITKYIVENTVGKLCEEKKTELGITDFDFSQNYLTQKTRTTRDGKKTRISAEGEKILFSLKDYRTWLLDLTICDPACGSGAFLNQALEFLIQEHAHVDELEAKLTGSSLILSDVENAILENNLFGVDINEESVEIARLSLWLRTAQKGRKLTSLNDNIKCGNSLIDDPEIAGEKAFHWEKEFPRVFGKGGFDVVIGNPPYVRVQTIKDSIERESRELESKFESATRRYDLFVLFMEKSYSLINAQGKVSFILPHKFLIADFGFGIRKFLRTKKFIERVTSFGHEIVFADASTYTCIIELSKDSEELEFIEIKPEYLFESKTYSKVSLGKLTDEKWELHDAQIGRLMTKLKSNPLILNDVLSGIYQGIKNTSDKIFMLKGEFQKDTFIGFSEELQENVELEAKIVYPVAKGKDIKRYQELDINYHVIYPHFFNGKKTVPYEEEDFRTNFPKAYNYLLKFKEFLIEKKVRFKTNPKYWYSLHRSREIQIFSDIKIVTATIQNYPHFTIDGTGALTDAGGYALTIKKSKNIKREQLIAILNSKLMWFFIRNTSSVYRGGYYAFNTTFLNPFPLPPLEIVNSYDFPPISQEIMDLIRKKYGDVDKITKYISSQFDSQVLNRKLLSWYELDFVEFIKEINNLAKKANGEKLSKKEEIEWMEIFTEYKAEIFSLQDQIEIREKRIDKLVYELYALTREEIEIVESA